MAQPASLESLTSGKRSATFEQPYEMMEACHERVHRMLALLESMTAMFYVAILISRLVALHTARSAPASAGPIPHSTV